MANIVRINGKAVKDLAAAADIAVINAEIGNLSDLDTTDKSSLVAAINEAAQSGGGGAVDDVKVNGNTVVTDGVANVPLADTINPGVVRIPSGTNASIDIHNGTISVRTATPDAIKYGTNDLPIGANVAKETAFYGLASAAGDTSQKQSVNPVGTYTANAKQAIKTMLGITDVTSYNALNNKPSINGVTLSGNSTLPNLGIASAEDVAAKYTKPSGGIPASDLASAVQTSLGKADTALQSAPVTSVNGQTGAVVLDASDVGAGTYSKPSGGIPASDLASAVQTSLGKADTALQTAPVASVAGKTGVVTLDAGDVEYDDTDTYAAGSVGAGLAELKSKIGDLANLTTTAKSNLVVAINEAAQSGGGSGTSDYSALSNKPSINNVTLSGNKSLSDIGAASAADVADLSTRVNMLGTANFDLTTATDHYYISSDGTKNDSTNWSAIVIDDPTRFYRLDATLGSNSSTILGISFFTDASLAKSSFISGVPIVTSGVPITANVPTNAIVAVVCTRTASYATPNATGYYAVSTVDANCNTALDALVNLEKYTPTQSVNVTFEQGSIASDTGAETSNANRIRSVGYIDVYNFGYAGCDYNHRIWFYEYDEFKRFIKGTVQTRHSFKYAELDSNTRYIRIVLCNEKTSTAITPTDVTGFYCVKDIVGTTIVDYTASSGLIEKMGAYPRPLYTVPSATTGSDYTIVGTKFVKFNDGSDDLTTDSGSITYRKYDNGFDQSPTSGEKYIYHYFGHCNSVDYNADNGCLILGNGSGSYNLPGKIFIIPDFDTILENAQNAVTTLTLQSTNAIVIDCTDYNLGSKFNVIWGEKNGTVSNIAYLITANFGKTTSSIDAGDVGVIRRLLLGMGSNQFSYGQFISGQSADAFNGTFEILDTYTQDGTAYNDCCQGTCYYKGEIVCAIGHNVPILWRMNLADGKIRRRVYEQNIYAGDGSVASSGATGICTDGERVYTGVVGVGVWALNL